MDMNEQQMPKVLNQGARLGANYDQRALFETRVNDLKGIFFQSAQELDQQYRAAVAHATEQFEEQKSDALQLGSKEATHSKLSLSKDERSNSAKKKGDGDSGGRAITLDSHNFDIILNILIGIRRSLSDISEISVKQLDDY